MAAVICLPVFYILAAVCGCWCFLGLGLWQGAFGFWGGMGWVWVVQCLVYLCNKSPSSETFFLGGRILLGHWRADGWTLLKSDGEQVLVDVF